MTTSHSPLSAIKRQADTIARVIKAVERGENPVEDVGGKIAAARNKESFKVGVVMDDKVITLDMKWTAIKEWSEVALAAYILKLMRGNRETAH